MGWEEYCDSELSFQLGFCCSIAYSRALSRMGKVSSPWKAFFHFGTRKVRVLAEERNEREGMYR